MKKRIITTIFLFIFFGLIINAEKAEDKKEIKLRKCPGKVKVITKEIVPGDFKEFKDIERKVVPANEVAVSSSISGIVKSIEKKEGDEVKTGDIILTLNTEKTEAELKIQKEKVSVWKKKLYNRQHWKVRSERAEKQAEKVLNEAQAKVDELNEIINNSILKAQMDGVLSKIKVNSGDLISANFEVCRIYNLEKIKIDISDYNENVSDLQKIKISIKELSENFEAVVKKDENGSSLFIVNDNKTIKKAMTAQFTLLIKEYTDAISLPNSIILKENSIRFVYVVNGKRARKVVVDTEYTDKNGVTLISNGLKKGDEVIVSEIISAKKGTLSKDLRCITNNKKIKVMVFNKEKNKYVKKKYKKKPVAIETETTERKIDEPKPKKKIKKKKKVTGEKKSFFSKISLGATASFNKMSSENFDELYGSMTTFGFDITYDITDKIDIWLHIGYGSKTATVEWAPEPLEFSYIPLSMDVRYKFAKVGKFSFLGGAGFTYFTSKDVSPIETLEDNIFGFNILAGTKYDITQQISLNMLFRMNFGKKEVVGTTFTPDYDLDLGGMELLLGVSFKLGK